MNALQQGMYHLTITIRYEEEYSNDNKLTMNILVFNEYRIIEGIPYTVICQLRAPPLIRAPP